MGLEYIEKLCHMMRCWRTNINRTWEQCNFSFSFS